MRSVTVDSLVAEAKRESDKLRQAEREKIERQKAILAAETRLHRSLSRPTLRDYIDRPRWTTLDEHSDEL